MKRIVIRVVALTLFSVLEIAAGGELGQIGELVWAVALSLAFAFAIVYLTGPARLFIVCSVAALTFVLPLVILFLIGISLHHSLWEVASLLARTLSSNFIQSAFQFLLPIVVTAISLPRFERLATSGGKLR
jgi:hypothetical protein